MKLGQILWPPKPLEFTEEFFMHPNVSFLKLFIFSENIPSV